MLAPSNIDTEILAELEAAERDDAAAKNRHVSAFLHRVRAGWRLLEKKEIINHNGQWRKYQQSVVDELAARGYVSPETGQAYSIRWLQDWTELARYLPTEEKARPVAHFGLKENLRRIRLANKPKQPTITIPGPLRDRHRIIHGNCLDILPTITEAYIREVFPTIQDGFEVCILSDPPYNQGCDYDGYDDNIPEREYQAMLAAVFTRYPSVSVHYPEETIGILGKILGIPDEVVTRVYNSNTLRQSRLVTWWGCRPDFSRLGQDYKNPKDRRIVERTKAGCKARGYDWWYIDQIKNVSKKFDHPCVLPVELVRRIILTTTKPGDVIIDPFCGSGTIPAVAAALGRYGIGIDQSEKYCRIAEARLATIEKEISEARLAQIEKERGLKLK
jgi:DNA methylase